MVTVKNDYGVVGVDANLKEGVLSLPNPIHHCVPVPVLILPLSMTTFLFPDSQRCES